MKNKKLAMSIAVITTVMAMGSTFCSSTAYAKENYDVNITEEAGENAYKVNYYDDAYVQQALDENRLILLKDNGVFKNPNSDIPKSYISIYDVNNKTSKDYKNINMDTNQFHGVSPSGRYVLFGEPRIIPELDSEEWEKSIENEELFNEKRDILDLSTGEVIENFDKTINNYEAQYKWLTDDYIFVDYGAYWKVLNRAGETIKEGKLDFSDSDLDWQWSKLIDISEIKVVNGSMSGKFYYTKNFRGADRSLGDAIYSMDINTKEEKLIGKYQYSSNTEKKGDTLGFEYFNNNGEAENGYFVNRTFGFKLIDKSGDVLRQLELPKGKSLLDFKLSPDGKKCAFIDGDSLADMHRNIKEDTLKVMDVNSGEVKEITNISKLTEDVGEYSGVKSVKWDSTGKSLIINCKFVAKADGHEHNSAYVIRVNK